MRHGKMFEIVRQSAGALLLLGGVELTLKSPTLAADTDCAVPAPTPACQPQCSDDIYKRAGDRLAQQLEQMNQCQSGGPAACAAPGNGCAPGGACESGKHCMFGSIFGDGCGCGGDKPLGDPWKLSKENGFDFGGWVQLGYASNPDGAFTGNGPFLDDREWSNVNLNQMYVYVTKVADGKKGFDWGFRADMMYGVDGNEAQAFGNNPGKWDFLNGWDHGIYELAMPQLYGEVAMGDLAVKAGHFYTPHGYEVVTSPDNFFFSKQLNFWNSEPFTHTGVQGTYKVNDKLSVLAHWVLGWDTGYDQFGKGNMGTVGFTYTFSEKTSLIYTSGFGDFGWRGDGVINCAILSHKWTEKFMTVHQFDILQTDLGSNLAAPGSLIAGDSHALINYAFYQLTDKAKAGVRYEWYKADGVSYNEFTYGVNYQVNANIVVRPEMRHNWSPANDVSPWNENIFGVDAIFKF